MRIYVVQQLPLKTQLTNTARLTFKTGQLIKIVKTVFEAVIVQDVNKRRKLKKESRKHVVLHIIWEFFIIIIFGQI